MDNKIRLKQIDRLEFSEFVSGTVSGLMTSGGFPYATESQTGVSRFANYDEIVARSSNSVAVTPVGLNSGLSWLRSQIPTGSTLVTGLVRLATVSESLLGLSSTLGVTPEGLKSGLESINTGIQNSTTSIFGKVRLATANEAISGVISSGAVITPTTLHSGLQLLSGQVNSLVSNSTTSVTGKVRLATVIESIEKDLETVAVTPLGLLSGIENHNSFGSGNFAHLHGFSCGIRSSSLAHSAVAYGYGLDNSREKSVAIGFSGEHISIRTSGDIYSHVNSGLVDTSQENKTLVHYVTHYSGSPTLVFRWKDNGGTLRSGRMTLF